LTTVFNLYFCSQTGQSSLIESCVWWLELNLVPVMMHRIQLRDLPASLFETVLKSFRWDSRSLGGHHWGRKLFFQTPVGLSPQELYVFCALLHRLLPIFFKNQSEFRRVYQEIILPNLALALIWPLSCRLTTPGLRRQWFVWSCKTLTVLRQWNLTMLKCYYPRTLLTWCTHCNLLYHLIIADCLHTPNTISTLVWVYGCFSDWTRKYSFYLQLQMSSHSSTGSYSGCL